MKSGDEQRDTFGEHVLHVGAGFKEKERPHVLETLSTLGPHLLGTMGSAYPLVEIVRSATDTLAETRKAQSLYLSHRVF